MVSNSLMDRLWVILVEPEGKINFGFILRLARNFGIKGICVVNPKFSLDDEEIKQFSSKGIEYLESGRVMVVSDLKECLERVSFTACTTAISVREGDVLRHSISPKAIKLIIPSKGDIGLVFGRESIGLSRDELIQCDVITTLKTGTDYNVLNLSHAVAMFLYEILRDEITDELIYGEECDQGIINVILKLIKDVAHALETPSAYVALKHVLKRASLRKDECSAMYKLFKKLKYIVRDFEEKRRHNS